MLEVIAIAIAVALYTLAIASGLFAINRDYFYKVSIYNQGMDICREA